MTAWVLQHIIFLNFKFVSKQSSLDIKSVMTCIPKFNKIFEEVKQVMIKNLKKSKTNLHTDDKIQVHSGSF